MEVGRENGCEDVWTVTVMVALECADVGLKTLFKAATLQGLNNNVFIVYSHLVASLSLLPAPFFSYRSRTLPPLRFSILCKILLLAAIGSGSQIIGYMGISYSSPTLSSAISNLVPAFTFLLAIAFGMEQVSLQKVSSFAKILGTILSIIGALVATLYVGPSIIIRQSPHCIYLHHLLQASLNSNWVIGGAFLTAEALLLSTWYIVQAQIMKEYPAKFTVTFFHNVFITFMTAILSVFEGTNAGSWIIRSDIALASIICSGLFKSSIYNTVHTWAIHLKGPLFVAMFKPLSIVIAIALGITFLSESLRMGSVIGGVIISIGFYAVMWGKYVEKRCENLRQNGGTENQTSSRNAPLLTSYQEAKV